MGERQTRLEYHTSNLQMNDDVLHMPHVLRNAFLVSAGISVNIGHFWLFLLLLTGSGFSFSSFSVFFILILFSVPFLSSPLPSSVFCFDSLFRLCFSYICSVYPVYCHTFLFLRLCFGWCPRLDYDMGEQCLNSQVLSNIAQLGKSWRQKKTQHSAQQHLCSHIALHYSLCGLRQSLFAD